MKGTLKHDDVAGWTVEYQHQLTISCTQRKELPLHPDDSMEIYYDKFIIPKNKEVDFYIVEVEKLSGPVQYAKLIISHSDQMIDEKSSEISDEEIYKASFTQPSPLWHQGFIEGAQWYRGQLKLKQ